MHIALFLTFLYGVYASQCGDGICDTNESCTSCPSDCQLSCVSNINPLAYCYGCQATSDAYCYVYEIGSCSAPPAMEQCGDGICGVGEDCYSCNLDCGSCAINALIWEYCGDFVCNNGETCQTCSNDCICSESLENSTAIELAATANMAATNANTENMPMLIGSITSGLLLMVIAGIGIGVILYKAHKKRLAKKEQEKEAKGKGQSTEHITMSNSMMNPILKTHSIQRNPVLSNNLSPSVRAPNSIVHKKSFAPQLATPTPDSMHSAPNSIVSDVMKKTQIAFLEQYDLSSFNAIHARQNVRKIRRPVPSSGARLADKGLLHNIVFPENDMSKEPLGRP